MKNIVSKIMIAEAVLVLLVLMAVFPVFMAVKYSIGVGVFTMISGWVATCILRICIKSIKEKNNEHD